MSQSGISEASATRDRVALEQLRLFHRNTPVSQVMTLLTTGLAALVFWSTAPQLHLLCWLGLTIIETIMRQAGGTMELRSPVAGSAGGFEVVLRFPETS